MRTEPVSAGNNVYYLPYAHAKKDQGDPPVDTTDVAAPPVSGDAPVKDEEGASNLAQKLLALFKSNPDQSVAAQGNLRPGSVTTLVVG